MEQASEAGARRATRGEAPTAGRGRKEVRNARAWGEGDKLGGKEELMGLQRSRSLRRSARKGKGCEEMREHLITIAKHIPEMIASGFLR